MNKNEAAQYELIRKEFQNTLLSEKKKWQFRWTKHCIPYATTVCTHGKLHRIPLENYLNTLYD